MSASVQISMTTLVRIFRLASLLHLLIAKDKTLASMASRTPSKEYIVTTTGTMMAAGAGMP